VQFPAVSLSSDKDRAGNGLALTAAMSMKLLLTIAANRAHCTVRKWGTRVESALSSVVDRKRRDFFLGRRPLWLDDDEIA
jgi:hypothetical protein